MIKIKFTFKMGSVQVLKDVCICCAVLFILNHGVKAQSTITVPLNKTVTLLDKLLYEDYILLNSSETLTVNFSGVNKNVSFIIFQVHSHLHNVTLYNNTLVKGSYVSGQDVGMYSSLKSLDTFVVMNPNVVDVKLYLTVHGYRTLDPIPGGCNMELPLPIAPYLVASYNKDYILVNGASAKAAGSSTCNNINSVQVTFYRLYLPEMDFSEEAYFKALRLMTSMDSILDNADEIPETGTMWTMKRMLGAYPGTGAVYVAIATSIVGYSIYVPTHTYACELLDENNACVLWDDTATRLVCLCLISAGVFICYFGHKFFKTEMFFIGMASGALITYIVISLIADLGQPALLGASVLSGIMFGALWLLCWWFYGIPVFALMLSILNLGFLVAAIVYLGLPGGIRVLEHDVNFWSFFVFIMLLITLVLLSLTFISNILCCCVLGGYAIIYPVDYYIGSNLKYIIINVVRRAVVPMFNRAVVTPPFEFNDALLVLTWFTLSFTGFLFQHCSNRGRPPFPPPPRDFSPRISNPPVRVWGPYGALGRNQVVQADAVIIHTNADVYNETTPLIGSQNWQNVPPRTSTLS